MAYPSDLARTKDWGTEVLTDADLEGQLDLIITWLMASLNASTGHAHTGSGNNGPKLAINAALTIASQAQGDVIYASSASAWARLGAGTAGQVLKTGGAAANPSWATVRSISGATKNLKVICTAAHPTYQVTVTADELALNDGTIISSVSQVIDIQAAAGAGGLMTGLTEAANTIYYIWIIRKSSDGTVNGILTTDPATISTLPTDYDQYALVSAVGNNNSINFIPFTQEGNYYEFTASAVLASGQSSSSNWANVDLTPANMDTVAGFVPSALSTVAFGIVRCNGDKYAAVSNVKTNGGTYTHGEIDQIVAFTNNTTIAIYWEYHIITADTLRYAASADSAQYLWLRGFKINKLPLG